MPIRTGPTPCDVMGGANTIVSREVSRAATTGAGRLKVSISVVSEVGLPLHAARDVKAAMVRTGIILFISGKFSVFYFAACKLSEYYLEIAEIDITFAIELKK